MSPPSSGIAQITALLIAGATAGGVALEFYHAMNPPAEVTQRDACLDALRVMAENFAEKR